MYDEYVIRVPGSFALGVAFLDLETVKTPTGGFVMKNGEPLRRRWTAYMAGVAYGSEVRIVERVGDRDDVSDELNFLTGVREAIGRADEIIYGATREFDEMILKGRFTNARRAHEPVPFFPALPDAESFSWRNVGNIHAPGFGVVRSPDADWRDEGYDPTQAPAYELSLVHNLRDVVTLILKAGDPDLECRAWCERVMTDTSFARLAIFGGED